MSDMNKQRRREEEKAYEDMVTEHDIRLLSFFFSFELVYTFIYCITNMLIVLLFLSIHLSIQTDIEYKHLGRIKSNKSGYLVLFN